MLKKSINIAFVITFLIIGFVVEQYNISYWVFVPVVFIGGTLWMAAETLLEGREQNNKEIL